MSGGPSDSTPNETFTLLPKADHPYTAAIHWAERHLAGPSGRALVIGSPPAEASALARLGWTVDYLDWRWEDGPMVEGATCHQGDAMALPFPDATFEALTTTCVYCHVGLGRYGDPVSENAEARMLGEMRRALKTGGRVAMMTGPCIVGRPTVIGTTTHRVTTLEEVVRQLGEGWALTDRAAFAPGEKRWREPGEAWATDPDNPDYLCVVLEAV